MHNPLEQFAIKKLIEINCGGIDISLTNSSAAMLLSVFGLIALMFWGVRDAQVIPSKRQVLPEMLFRLVKGVLVANAGPGAVGYVGFILSLFLFILTCNLVGILPYSFTATSHIAVTFPLAIMVFITVIATGFVRHGSHFFSLLLPKGTPSWLAPIMVLIEFCSFFSRPISLGMRLAANMVAGHVLLKVIAGFAVALSVALKPFPVATIGVLICFEAFVAVLQAYIFVVLACVYLNDGLNLH